MNLIIFPPQHALPLCSSTVNQSWFSTVQLACCKTFAVCCTSFTAVCCLTLWSAGPITVQYSVTLSQLQQEITKSKSTVKPQAVALAVIMRLQRKLPDPLPLSRNRVWPHKTTISMCISFVWMVLFSKSTVLAVDTIANSTGKLHIMLSVRPFQLVFLFLVRGFPWYWRGWVGT